MKIATVRRYALSLPEVTEEPHFELSSFRVRGRIFATVPPDEEHLHLFVAEPVRVSALASYPECLEKLYWGKRVAGLRLKLAKAKPSVVKLLVLQAWMDKAPKRLVAVSEGPASR